MKKELGKDKRDKREEQEQKLLANLEQTSDSEQTSEEVSQNPINGGGREDDAQDLVVLEESLNNNNNEETNKLSVDSLKELRKELKTRNARMRALQKKFNNEFQEKQQQAKERQQNRSSQTVNGLDLAKVPLLGTNEKVTKNQSSRAAQFDYITPKDALGSPFDRLNQNQERHLPAWLNLFGSNGESRKNKVEVRTTTPNTTIINIPTSSSINSLNNTSSVKNESDDFIEGKGFSGEETWPDKISKFNKEKSSSTVANNNTKPSSDNTRNIQPSTQQSQCFPSLKKQKHHLPSTQIPEVTDDELEKILSKTGKNTHFKEEEEVTFFVTPGEKIKPVQEVAQSDDEIVEALDERLINVDLINEQDSKYEEEIIKLFDANQYSLDKEINPRLQKEQQFIARKKLQFETLQSRVQAHQQRIQAFRNQYQMSFSQSTENELNALETEVTNKLNECKSQNKLKELELEKLKFDLAAFSFYTKVEWSFPELVVELDNNNNNSASTVKQQLVDVSSSSDSESDSEAKDLSQQQQDEITKELTAIKEESAKLLKDLTSFEQSIIERKQEPKLTSLILNFRLRENKIKELKNTIEIRGYYAEIEHLKQKRRNIQSEIANEQNSFLVANNARLNAQFKHVQRILMANEKQLHNLEQERKIYASELQITDCIKKERLLNEEIKDLEKIVGEMNKQQLDKENQEFKSTMLRLEAQLSEANSEYVNLQNCLSQSQELLQGSVEEVQSYVKLEQEIGEKKGTCLKQIQQIKEQMEQLKAGNAKLNAPFIRYNDIQQQLQQIPLQIEQLKLQIQQELSEQNKALKRREDELNRERNKIPELQQNDLLTMELEAVKLQQELNLKKSQKVATTDYRSSFNVDEVEALTKALTSKINQYETEKQQLKQEAPLVTDIALNNIEQIDKLLASHAMEIEQYSKQSSFYEKSIQSINKQIDDLKDLFSSDKTTTIATNTKKIIELPIQLEILKLNKMKCDELIALIGKERANLHQLKLYLVAKSSVATELRRCLQERKVKEQKLEEERQKNLALEQELEKFNASNLNKMKNDESKSCKATPQSSQSAVTVEGTKANGVALSMGNGHAQVPSTFQANKSSKTKPEEKQVRDISTVKLTSKESGTPKKVVAKKKDPNRDESIFTPGWLTRFFANFIDPVVNRITGHKLEIYNPEEFSEEVKEEEQSNNFENMKPFKGFSDMDASHAKVIKLSGKAQFSPKQEKQIYLKQSPDNQFDANLLQSTKKAEPFDLQKAMMEVKQAVLDVLEPYKLQSNNGNDMQYSIPNKDLNTLTVYSIISTSLLWNTSKISQSKSDVAALTYLKNLLLSVKSDSEGLALKLKITEIFMPKVWAEVSPYLLPEEQWKKVELSYTEFFTCVTNNAHTWTEQEFLDYLIKTKYIDIVEPEKQVAVKKSVPALTPMFAELSKHFARKRSNGAPDQSKSPVSTEIQSEETDSSLSRIDHNIFSS